jgi:hypothetical protein
MFSFFSVWNNCTRDLLDPVEGTCHGLLPGFVETSSRFSIHIGSPRAADGSIRRGDRRCPGNVTLQRSEQQDSVTFAHQLSTETLGVEPW